MKARYTLPILPGANMISSMFHQQMELCGQVLPILNLQIQIIGQPSLHLMVNFTLHTRVNQATKYTTEDLPKVKAGEPNIMLQVM